MFSCSYLSILFIFFISYKLYWVYLMDILDCIAGFLSTISILIGGFRMKVVDYNLQKIFPDMTLKEKENIKYKSLKISFINLLLPFHQRLLLDKNKNYIKNRFIIEEGVFSDTRRIIACAHYGIIYHPTIFSYYFGKTSFLYKNKLKILDNILFPKKIFNTYGIYPFKHNEMSGFYREQTSDNLIIICDQKGNSEPLKYLLHEDMKIFNSPATLHYKLNIPIYVYFSRYNFNQKKIYQKIIKIKIVSSDNVQSITQKIANLFTNEIIKYPEQYLWAHNLFNMGKK